MAGRFRRHLGLVAVSILVNGVAKQAIYTGFFLQVSGALYWVTAAHCVEEISSAGGRKGVRVLGIGLIDCRRRAEPPIPWDVREHLLPGPASDDVDVAIACVRGNARDLVRANPDTVPLDESALEGCEVATGVAWALCGNPVQWTTSSATPVSGGVALSMRSETACLPVTVSRTKRGPSDHPDFWDNPKCLYRRVTLREGWPNKALDSIVGMSGGPVFSLEPAAKGNFRYRLVGLQSKWLASRRVVRIEPTRAIVGTLELLRQHGHIQESETEGLGRPAEPTQ